MAGKHDDNHHGHTHHCDHQHHSHDHNHGHSHDHSHGPHVHFNYIEGEEKHKTLARIRAAFILNFIFAVIELIGGFYTNSVSVISNAIHDFGDSLTLAIAYVLEHVSHKKSDSTFSYGYRRLSSVAAIITGIILISGSLFVLGKSIPRIFNPEPANASGMLGLAVLGLAVNGLAAYRLSKGASHHERMLLLHLLEDVLGWTVVLVGSVVMMFFPWYFLDALMAVAVSVWLLKNAYVQIKNLLKILLQATPAGFDINQVMGELKKEQGVQDIHHPHLWTLDGRSHIFTAHVVVASETSMDVMEKIKDQLKHRLLHLGINEATLELESSNINCESKAH